MSDIQTGPKQTEKKRVLIVDDEAINREILGMLLSDDYDLLFAADGQEAMNLIRKNSDTLALILLDLMMPVVSGMVVLKQLSQTKDLSKIPVIVMTADQESEVACLELGALDFIPKPYPRRDIVLARVRRTIELSEDRQIIRSTERDPLTGLYNREYFYSYAESYDQFHKMDAMDAIVVDINHFHMLNERYGRAYADQVLRHIGERLREMVHEEGGIVCRREADLFMVYCPHREDYKDILTHASVGLEAGENAIGGQIRLRMGVYPNVDKTIEMEQRFDRAKNAADAVRSNYTQNISVYDDKLHEAELFSEQLVEDFDRAIRERQFKVYYQPKFDIRADKAILSSAEALIRWQHPRLGLISPGLFIPLFEENGLVQRLDNYVWAEAAAQVRAWKERYGVVVPVSVNVSRVDMFDLGLVSTFERLLKENCLEPEELLLEITESAYTDDAEFIISTVNDLRRLGLKVEMDDFGTGYSSLGMISHLPIDALKLDMMFVRNAFTGQGDVRMLELIIDIADYLNVPVIAEGVETKEQVNALKTMGCDIVQGFYFSRPIPPEDFNAFVEEKKRALESAVFEAPARPSGDHFMPISTAMVGDFDSLYYVDMGTGYYMEFGTQSWHENLRLQKGGEDFFGDVKRDVLRVIEPKEQDRMVAVLDRDNLAARLKREGVVTVRYHLMIDGEPQLYQLRAARGKNGDDQHVAIAVSRVSEEAAQAPEEPAADMDFSSLASVISGQFDTIYYVDVETDAFTVFNTQTALDVMEIHGQGEGFFAEFRRDMLRKVYEADQARVSAALTREALLGALRDGRAFNLDCRLSIDGALYACHLAGFCPDGEEKRHLLIGVRSVKTDAQWMDEDAMKRGSVTFARIVQALSQDYFTVYYVNVSTRAYIEYSMEGESHQMYPVAGGGDFFADCAQQVPERVAAADRERVAAAFQEENLLKAIRDNKVFSSRYQVLVDGRPVNVHVKAMFLPGDTEHIVIGVNNIDTQMKRQEEYEKTRKQSLTYSRIAQALSQDYYSIYLVNMDTDEFIEYGPNSDYQDLHVEQSGVNFFEDCRRNVIRLVHPDDLKKALTVWEKSRLLQEIKDGQSFSVTYRLMFDGTPVYINCKVIRLSDNEAENYFIIGISNVDAQMRREQEYAEDLKRAKVAALRDALTGVKSKLAFTETEREINEAIGRKTQPPFAVAVCDVNGLKTVNDTQGHKAGDQFIKDACAIVCNLFKHSPVYRIGGDEFVAILMGSDYGMKDELSERFAEINSENRENEGIVIACGVSAWNPEEDRRFEAVFDRADALMYENKKRLKA